MLVVRGTKKLRDRVHGVPGADDETSTTTLGDWFATALFWRPHVALLVNARTFVPIFMKLAPAATLLDRIPEAIEQTLRLHGVDDHFVSAERLTMAPVRIAPTNDRSVVGVMNEFATIGRQFQMIDPVDLEQLSLRVAHTPVGPLRSGAGFPDRALAEAVGGVVRPVFGSSSVVPLPRTGALSRPAASTAAVVAADVYQLKVTLHDTKPPVWRRILVDGASTLDLLHEAIQAAFGWWNYHLHEFEIEGTAYGVPNDDWDDWGLPVVDERTIRLDAVAAAGDRFEYRYDFGDDWRHRIIVEKVHSSAAGLTVPACIDGRRACPPEDCGGTWGYEELLEILADPSHPEHRERRDWLGHPFDPEAFDPEEFEVNLHNLRLVAFDD